VNAGARLVGAVAALALAACGLDPIASPLAAAPDASAPAPTTTGAPTATPFPDAGPPGSSAPQADAGTVKRTVAMRNPFGGPAGNLFVDGDVELSALPAGGSGQYGVLGFDSGGAGAKAFPVETGGLCKSGVHCAIVDKGQILFFRGAAARASAGDVARVSIKPPAGSSCAAVEALLVSCDSQTLVKKLAPPKQPDDAGWCELSGTSPPRDFALCLLVQNGLPAGATALVDAATLVPDDGTIEARKGEIWVPDAATAARLAAIGSYLRRTMPLGGPPPAAARQAADR
jgi:hypothetical protein